MSAQRATFVDAQNEQPEALARIAGNLSLLIERGALASVGGAQRPLFLGIGASYAGLALPIFLLESSAIPAQRMLASDAVGNPTIHSKDLVVAVSQGGKSVETLDAFESIADIARIAIVNRSPSPLADAADVVFDLGNETDSWASTIGYTGTLIALSMVARTIVGADAVSEWHGIDEAARDFRRTAQLVVDRLAHRLADVTSADLVASVGSASVAESGALLFREVARLPSTAARTRNYLHGEMESAGDTLHIVFGDGREIELARSLARPGHLTLLLTTAAIEDEDNLFVLSVPDASIPVRAVLETIAMQVFSTALADARGVDIEDFVFANHDIKVGGITEVLFKDSSTDIARDTDAHDARRD